MMIRVLEFDASIFSATSVEKAAYRQEKFLLVDIKTVETKITCSCEPTHKASEEQFAYAVEEFRKDVLDYNLREKIANETEGVRNLILGIAFSKTSAVNG